MSGRISLLAMAIAFPLCAQAEEPDAKPRCDMARIQGLTAKVRFNDNICSREVWDNMQWKSNNTLAAKWSS